MTGTPETDGSACWRRRKLPAVHDGHHEIEQNHVGTVGFLEILERFAAIRHGRGVESLEVEQLRHHVAQVGIILDDQNRTVMDTGMWPCSGLEFSAIGGHQRM
jgi:hypothetical protein